jgi:hypothetical protein
MLFIDSEFPMIVSIRERQFDESELEQLAAAFDVYFRRGERYATLSVTTLTAKPVDARARSQIAAWANQPRVRHFSKLLCVGSATVTARAWERRALTAFQWLWTPVAPHRAVSTVSEGLSFCIAHLVAAGVALPSDAIALESNLTRTISAFPIAGLPACGATPPGEVGAGFTRGEKLQVKTLADADGAIEISWLGASVLWARFTGHLSVELATAYAGELEERLPAARAVQYFIDSGSLESYDLAARTIGLGVLASYRARLSSILALNWSASVSDVGQAILAGMSGLMHLTTNRVEFEAKLLAAAPLAGEVIDSRRVRSKAKSLAGLD